MAVLAVTLDLVMAGLQRLVVSPGLTRRYGRVKAAQMDPALAPEPATS